MAALNILHLIGTVTRGPELKYTQAQTAVCEIGLAINEKRKDKAGNWVEHTTFVDITYFGRQAEVCAEFLGKGSSIYVEGKLNLDQWEKDGKKFSKLKVIGERMQMLDRKATGEPRRAPQSERQPQRQAAPVGPPDDDVPF